MSAVKVYRRRAREADAGVDPVGSLSPSFSPSPSPLSLCPMGVEGDGGRRISRKMEDSKVIP
jgi:hypothetical protein